jgi:DNA-binding NtrC family response regulator
MTPPATAAFLRVSDPVTGRHLVPLVVGERITLGRAPSNRIVVHDERASRFHAEVFSTAEGWVIRDLESRNGTLIDGERLTVDRRLAVGDVLQIGMAEIAYGEGEPIADTTSAGQTDGSGITGEMPAELAARHASVARPRDPRRRLGEEPPRMVGSSPALQGIVGQIVRVANTKATVLVRGESGSGKELVARAIHEASERRDQPFICLNCAALSETLLESELFGHEKGAFTGATEKKIGKFEAADRGTLVLDEIGEMSPAIQAKFLRVLEGHPFERVGGSSRVQVDVRVVAATNRDLEAAVAAREFRRDLYFRLKVVEIIVPPLRRRPEDIEAIATHFLDRFAAETGRMIRGFTPEAVEAMRTYHWPGNIRELRNVIERAVVLARGEWIDVGDMTLSKLASPGDTGKAQPVRPAAFVPTTIEEMERQHVMQTLAAVGGNKTKAAAILGIERSTLDRKLAKWAQS